MEFDWDEGNLTHIAEHGVSAEEVEYALERPTLELERQDWNEHEEYFQEAGMTGSGRILVVFTTWRGPKLRVVTAYDAPAHVVKEFFESRGR